MLRDRNRQKKREWPKNEQLTIENSIVRKIRKKDAGHCDNDDVRSASGPQICGFQSIYERENFHFHVSICKAEWISRLTLSFIRRIA